MKKSIKILQGLSYIDDLHLSYDELDRFIEECEMLLDSNEEDNENI